MFKPLVVFIKSLFEKVDVESNWQTTLQNGSRISGKGVHKYKGMGIALLYFISFFPKHAMKMK